MTRLRLALRAVAVNGAVVSPKWLDPNLLQVRIVKYADSKKAPLGRLFTLVGRAGFEPATN